MGADCTKFKKLWIQILTVLTLTFYLLTKFKIMPKMTEVKSVELLNKI